MGQYMAGDYSAGLASVASIMAAGIMVQAGAFSSSRSPANGSKEYAGTLIIKVWSRARLGVALLSCTFHSAGRRDFW
jgi:hypothetical protein